jgi:hypothetical protein
VNESKPVQSLLCHPRSPPAARDPHAPGALLHPGATWRDRLQLQSGYALLTLQPSTTHPIANTIIDRLCRNHT